MKRIAIFQDDLNIGGIQKSLINLLNYIPYDKYCVDLYLFSKSTKWESKINKCVNVKYLTPLNKIYKYLSFDLAFTKSNYRFEDLEDNYDIAIDFNSYQPWTAAAALSVPANKRAIWVHNDIKIKYSEEWKYRVLFNAMKSKYQFFEAIAFVSEPLIASFENITKVSGKDYYVIPNIIDTNEIFSACKNNVSDISIDSTKVNVCAVGKLCHQKGYDIMVSNFIDAYSRNNNLRLYIIGDGPDIVKLTELVKKKNMSSIINILGSMENPYSIMNKCDAFISTSRYEGQGMNIMEAKALGLEIVIPRHLEKYVDDVHGTDDVSQKLASLDKKSKNTNNLESYNNNILAKIDSLC